MEIPDGVILVVSHDPRLADVRQKRLQDAGYEVVSAMNIQSVRAACETQKIKLAVIGHSLPAAEKRRVWLEVRQLCGGRVPILELRNDGSPAVTEPTVTVLRPEKLSALADQVRRILEA